MLIDSIDLNKWIGILRLWIGSFIIVEFVSFD